MSESQSVVSNSLQPRRLYSPWNSPGHNTAVGSLSLLQGIFPSQGSNPGLPPCRWILYQLSSQRFIHIAATERVKLLLMAEEHSSVHKPRFLTQLGRVLGLLHVSAVVNSAPVNNAIRWDSPGCCGMCLNSPLLSITNQCSAVWITTGGYVPHWRTSWLVLVFYHYG